MSRRAAIAMSESELHAFLAEQRIVTCASIGPNGRPHLMPLWYVVQGSQLTSWTYGKSQKVKNLERLPQATLQVEAGGSIYGELRGAMLECDVELVRDVEAVTAIGVAIALRYAGLPETSAAEVRGYVETQAPKRVGLRFRPTRIATWDHRKLGH